MDEAGVFEGCRVLCTSVRHPERNELKDLILRHGGVLVIGEDILLNPPNVVVTRAVRSPKLALLQARRAVDVVSPSWVTLSAAAGKRLPTADFALPPLAGFVVCLSGFTKDEKDALEADIVSAGAQHQAALDRRCSHLVTCTDTSDKYR
ncbi:hypothetical protein H632_c348p0 [Helicosporidium sp. ATCC 50920]|nr:hypothetical protein H632_c348p0 [Helicosporidium sp. ATCC 50920]|eukprot:KDD76117.1 hypothetical protein H632_c348p0 [Helicosporidium sp. ATCC 50920]